MDLFDSKRQERLEAARKASVASKEAARKFLIEAGILLPNGEVAPHLRESYGQEESFISSVTLQSGRYDFV